LRITTGVGTDTDRNALYTPIAIDAYWSSGNPDGKADVFYAGDEYGNLWRFDLSGTSAAAWKTPSQPLFAGDRARPITALPAVTLAPAVVSDAAGRPSGSSTPDAQVMVFFGTGRFYADANKSAAADHRFYGVYDDGARLGLTEADLIRQIEVAGTDANSRVYQHNLVVSYGTGQRGWFIALPDVDERVIDRALVRNDLVHFNTVVPGSAMCDAGGKGWEMVVMQHNGGSAKGAQWDYNQDGSLDSSDTLGGLSYAGRKLVGRGMPGAPRVIGNQLYTPLVDKVGTTKGPQDHFHNTRLPSDSTTSGRISWIQLQPQRN
jgi:type IV pilus assembly protein PilY1